eukprot:Plantae.Rhodophyta-Purpureofilum_apyrenoidigerum.ctg4260.p1 GENE.Plantae.Rhodophyta-Purpureofilum_apyrenoidigerum.ctg4260~~Plantae.Rhodophyta-Purpureofilum_apyrenoidigerum.ctg4260.p1  ORF type:complete len:314 (+),score=61.13 Plantae.Rhodophyta-Purpureofilum_apyrenoidigerum.ctg4260:45-944(+)
MPVNVLDENYLGITALVLFGWNFVFYVITATLKFDKLTDFAGGTGFALAALLTFLLNQTYYPTQIAVTVMVLVWSLRLALFLLYRIIKWGEDNRFDSLRENPLKLAGFWAGQFMWNFVVSLVTIAINSADYRTGITALEIVAYIFWSIGLIIEVVADIQKSKFKASKEGKNHWCDVGLWKYSRHPNYFGEMLVWWSLFVSGMRVYNATWRWVAVLSPLFTMATLLFGSGVSIAEDRYNSKFGSDTDYLKYKYETSNLIPMLPSIYKKIPSIVKKVFFFEYPMYFKGIKEQESGERGEHA